MVETPQPTNSTQSSIWGKVGTRMIQVKNEAEKYLSEDVTVYPDNGGPNALHYWKVSILLGLFGFIIFISISKSVQHVYPQLSRMAYERIWSVASATDTKKRNRLRSERLASLQFLKNTYRKRQICKMTPAEKKRMAGGKAEAD